MYEKFPGQFPPVLEVVGDPNRPFGDESYHMLPPIFFSDSRDLVYNWVYIIRVYHILDI